MAEMTTEHTVPGRATSREWIGLGVLTLAALVYAMDLTVLNLAIPRISEELRPSSAQLLWIIDIYGFLVAGLLITMFLDQKQRSTAIGVWIAAYSAGGAIGPVLGGVLLEFFWWGSVFLIGVPVMALLLVLGPRTLPEYRDPNAGRLHIRSAAMSLLAILAIVFGLKEIAQDGISAVPVLAILA